MNILTHVRRLFNPHIDYQGNERLSGYIRDVNVMPCPVCKTTGRVGYDWCSYCGGYGDVDRTSDVRAPN